MMPVLVVMTIFISVFSLMQPGAMVSPSETS